MSRKNDKQQITNYKNSIKKSNVLSMAKLSHGLSLNQMQLLAYAIYSTQHDGKTKFHKYEFQKKFELKQYRTEDAYKDSEKLLELKASTQNLREDRFRFWNIFSSMEYDAGKFTFNWTPDMIPHILELKEKFVVNDLTITSKFRSGFSWTLYEYLKAHYGNWYKEFTKEELMRLFSVEERKTYKSSTAQFKRGVLDKAIQEVNAHTELEIWYEEKRIGNKITHFIIHWSTGTRVAGATDKQIYLLKEISAAVEYNMMEYLTVTDINIARNYIIKIKNVDFALKKGLSLVDADILIRDSLVYYDLLENLLEQDGVERDKSVYYNWLEELGEIELN